MQQMDLKRHQKLPTCLLAATRGTGYLTKWLSVAIRIRKRLALQSQISVSLNSMTLMILGAQYQRLLVSIPLRTCHLWPYCKVTSYPPKHCCRAAADYHLHIKASSHKALIALECASAYSAIVRWARWAPCWAWRAMLWPALGRNMSQATPMQRNGSSRNETSS